MVYDTVGTPVKRVALLLHEDSGFVRGLLEGLRDYAVSNGWIVRFIPPEDPRAYIPLLQQWQPDGVIANAQTQADLEALRDLGVPVVDVGNSVRRGRHAWVGVDDASIGRTAVEHFRRLGFQSMHFIGYAGFVFSTARETAYREYIQVNELAEPQVLHVAHGSQVKPRHIMKRETTIRNWLSQLPTPSAVFVANDTLALEVSTCCRAETIRVPEDIALLGVDDDALLCSLCDPPLSSIGVPLRAIGGASAEALSALMRESTVLGRKSDSAKQVFDCLPVTQRQSTTVLSIDNEDIANAVRYIREHACEAIGVDDVLRHIPLSRRMLERKFQHYLGRSPLQEIRRVRMEKACMLLQQRELSVSQIAEACGFQNAGSFIPVFKSTWGKTPHAYRQDMR